MSKKCLSGAYMATSVIQKANARLKSLYRKRKFLNLTTKKLLVMSLIQCHFDYACSFWYPGLSKVLKNKLQVTQNKIKRFVLNMDSRAHVGSEVFKSLGWSPVSKRVDQIILNHVFKVKSGQSPNYTLFQQVPYIHMELDLGKLVVFLFQQLKVLQRNPLELMVVFYRTSFLVI